MNIYTDHKSKSTFLNIIDKNSLPCSQQLMMRSSWLASCLLCQGTTYSRVETSQTKLQSLSPQSLTVSPQDVNRTTQTTRFLSPFPKSLMTNSQKRLQHKCSVLAGPSQPTQKCPRHTYTQ